MLFPLEVECVQTWHPRRPYASLKLRTSDVIQLTLKSMRGK